MAPLPRLAYALVALFGCGRAASVTPNASATPVASTTPAPEPAVAVAVADADADAPAAPAFALAGIPLPHAAGTGPIKVEGYPRAVHTGMSDAASAFGYLRDGKTYARCELDMCCREASSRCTLFDENDKPHELVSPILFADDPKRADREKLSLKELRDFPTAEGLAVMKPISAANAFEKKPPPLTATIPYGDEITIFYKEIPPTAGPDGTIKIPGSVRIGGKLPGESPVFVAFPPQPSFCVKVPIACMDAELNGISVTPSGDEIAFLVFTHNPSHGSSFAHLRMKTTALAALVFNDTGMKHHERKEWAMARDLFVRAVYADPTKELFAYNLACALAQGNDPRAEVALRRAIELGGDAVKKRAQKDSDFAAMRETAWFKALAN